QAQVGTRHSVERLLGLMMGVSDNIAALTLLDRIGVEPVNALAARLGLPATRIQRRALATPPDALRGYPAGSRLPPDTPNRTSARDAGTFLELLARGRLFDPETTAFALGLMQQGLSSDWLGPGLPPTVPLAHKSGELPGVRHDCGVAFAPSGPFVICVLTSDLRDQDRAGRTITTIARLTYQHFSRQ